ncbi:MAG TPA: hypothetical protein VFQ91_05960 [Bryobacteraceae bacterium]|nr:hypothetical protein [Bryobacteraceae bacterium]
MSLLRRTLHLSAYAALVSFGVFSQPATNLYLLPNSSATSPTVTPYRTDPFSTLGTAFPVQPGASFLLMHPNGQKLYSVARSGADTVLVLDANNPGTVLKRLSLGQAEAAAISPDGRRLLVVAGALHIIDTTSDTVLAAPNDVGNQPVDVAVALDASRAFVLSGASNRLTAVDLNTNTVQGPPITVPGQASGVTVGPNGLVYVSTVNLVQVIDGRTMTMVKEIPLNATPGKLLFTPNGSKAVAVNRTPITGSSVLMFDVASHRLESMLASFQVTLDRLVYGANGRIFALSNQTMGLYSITTSPALAINSPEFSGLGALSSISDMAVSGEIPDSRFLFLALPGTIQRIDLSAGNGLDGGRAGAPSQPGPLVHLFPQSTGTTPTTVLGYNAIQTTKPGETTLPLIARVLNSVGRPLFGVSVTFATDNPNAQIQGTTVTTNAEGWAQTTVVTPATAGTFNVTASAGPGPEKPTATYTITTSTGSNGGTDTGLLSIVSGQGQLVREQFLLPEPMTVRVRDANGTPISGQNVTFTLANGNGTLAISTFDGTIIPNTNCTSNTCTSTTDADGLASVSFLATLVSPGLSYSQQTVAATSGQATVNFLVNTVLSSLPGGGGQAAQPLVERIKPTDSVIVGQAGTTLNEAVQVRVVASSGIQSGQPIPGVGLRVRSENRDPAVGPVAVCDGEGGVALTDATGLATCNLKITGRLGTTGLSMVVGSAQTVGGTSVQLQVKAGPPSVLRIIQGNSQSGNPGQRLTLAFVAEVQDAFGNALAGQAVNWEVPNPASMTLSNVVSVSDSNGRVSALGTIGNVAGQSSVRVRIGSVVQTFNFTTNLTISQMTKVSGDNQTTAISQPFAAGLVVEVRDERNSAVPGQAVQWSVVSGPALVSSAVVATDANGRSSVTVRAASTAGTATVRAQLGSLTQTFTLTVRPPGPVFTAAGIVTTARNQPGVSPCGLATIYGTNLASGVSGVVNTSYLGIGALPLSYNNVEVLIGGIAAPILAVSNQSGTESLVVQTPCEVAPGQTSVLIRIPGAQAQVDNVRVFTGAPGVFETAGAGSQRAYAAIVRPDGSYVTPTNPARRGETLFAAVTGLGQTTPAMATNRIGLGNQLVAAPLVVGVNNQGVRVVSAYTAIGMIGVYWVAFELPLDMVPGVSVPFSIAVENSSSELVFSNSSTIAAVQ